MCDTCIVPGCTSKRHRPNGKYRKLQRVCLKHYLAQRSGRVGPNWERDIYNHHRKGHCECCGVTASQLAEQYLKPLNLTRKRDIIRYGMMFLQGDHIDGRDFPEANHPENIMTLCQNCHKAKSIINGDHKPNKRKQEPCLTKLMLSLF